MYWRRAAFKGSDVWAEVDEAGSPVVTKGRVQIRYNDRPGAKLYGGGASRLELDGAAPIIQIDDGGAAKSGGSKKGSGFGKAGKRSEQQAAMAKAAAESLIRSLEGESTLCFTDGACKGNPGQAGSGAVVLFLDGRKGEACRSLGRATNNIAELTAIDMALSLLEEGDVDPSSSISIFTDSSYSHGVLCKGWKAKKNTELILGLRARLSRFPGAKIHWIAGHVGVEGNERADALANDGVAGLSQSVLG